VQAAAAAALTLPDQVQQLVLVVQEAVELALFKHQQVQLHLPALPTQEEAAAVPDKVQIALNLEVETVVLVLSSSVFQTLMKLFSLLA
jgi:hypothetical protein